MTFLEVVTLDALNSPQNVRNSEHQAQNSDGVSVTNEDDCYLRKLGYRSFFVRGKGFFTNLACSFLALNCVGGTLVLSYIALEAARLLCIFSVSRRRAFRSDGDGKVGRFISFLVPAWPLGAWTTFLASDSFGVANDLILEIIVVNSDELPI
ncbi:hypothetical protein N7530_002664 [Penicillium desertorum]|uniref:Uncharacterized protein n=1 Tax=Penicillium desertorum TaxID=1303715 RepID=A0A9W9X468_9EURO|nr:hypothetical protein N7530_002664 [Penicillium desertorum]